MDYVNKKTGEVFEVETTNLSNICNGDLDIMFKSELRSLVERMVPGDKGAITIKINISMGVTDDIPYVSASAKLSAKYPGCEISSGTDMNIGQDGHLVQRKEKNMFEQEER